MVQGDYPLHPRMKALCSASCGLRSESQAKRGGAVARERKVAKTRRAKRWIRWEEWRDVGRCQAMKRCDGKGMTSD